MTRILVTGAHGQVGTYLVPMLDGHEVLACSHAQLDISDRTAVEGLVGEFVPQVVINTAAMTDVDGCETNPERAYAVNALAVRWIAIAASRVGAHLVQVSTDYVFDGTALESYREWDTVNPISVYGKSKLAGEIECAAHATSWSIARTAWVYGKPGGDFVSWVLRADAAGDLHGLVDDQAGSPTYAKDLAAVLVQLAARRAPGVFHVANAGVATRFAQGVAALEAVGRTTDHVKGMPSSALPRPAARPAFSALADTALAAAGIAPMRPWRDALVEYCAGL
ncbi:MAG: dTDP-4-dehydrorhamnose reductase [Acidimicrobiia bacterium]